MAKANSFRTPLLRVSRPVSACQRCRSAKIKCDGKLPACTGCERAGKTEQCSSANDAFAKGKERNYVASLENRVERLEGQISRAKSQKSAFEMLNIARMQPLLLSNSGAIVGQKSLQRKEARDVDDLVSDFGFLSVNATARDFHGFDKEMSFARLILATSTLEEMPKFTTDVLPQRFAIAPLIQHYLENIHTLYPFLSETSLFASIDAVYQHAGRNASSMDHWTTRLVLAIALASLSRTRGDTQYDDAVRHAAAAFAHTESVLHPGSISGTQAILLMVLYAMLDPHHFNSWYLIGVGCRTMVDLGLHQKAPPELRLREVDLELRHRVFDSVYALDRCISMVHLRAFSFTDDSTNVLAPRERSTSSTSKSLFLYSLEPSAQLAALRRLQSTSYQQLFQASRLDMGLAQVQTWHLISDSLHNQHQWVRNLSAQTKTSLKNYFRCEVLYSSILVLSPPGWTETMPVYGRFLIFEYATEYAELMLSILKDLENFVFYTSHDLLRVSLIAERFVTVVNSNYNLLFSGVEPALPSGFSFSFAPPAIPNRGVSSLLKRAYACLKLLEETLEYLGIKYGYADPLDEFRNSSGGLKLTLQANI